MPANRTLVGVTLFWAVVVSPRLSPAQKPNQNPPQPQQQQQQQQAEPKLPKLSEMPLPAATDLLTKPPVDWIVLNNDDVIVVQPVYPRPDTLAQMQKKIEDFDNKKPRPKTPEEMKKRKADREALHYLEISLPAKEGEENPEFRLHMKHIKQIIHHEELMLRRVDKFVDEGKIKDAFEMLFGIERRLPNWPGIQGRRNHLLFAEATANLNAKEFETALVRFEELHSRDPKFRGLKEKLGEAVDQLITNAVKVEDYRRAKHFLARLRRISASHPVAVKWMGELKSRSSALLDQAREASKNGKHDVAADFAQRAARVWPLISPSDKETYRRIANRYQRLKVGVLRLPGERSAYFLPTDADLRFKRLTQIALFEVDRTDDVPHYRTRFFEQWEPNDLGRQTVFTLRQSRQYWETAPIVNAVSIVAALSERFDHASPSYDERFAAYADSLSVLSPFEFVVHFDRVPLRTEALFHFPLSHNGPKTNTGRQTNGPQQPAGAEIITRRFRLHEQNEKRAVYRRSIPEPDGVSRYHVAEVVEKKYDSHDRAIQGLLRDEVSLLPHVRSRDADRLRSDKRFFVNSYSLPVTHLLQFNPNSKPLRNRQLRGALVYALDRQRILTETVLRDSDPAQGRVISAPWSSNSYAYNTLVEPRRYDLMLAFSLAAAASRPLGGKIPQLKMICLPDPIVEAAANELIRQWSRIGIKVQLLSNSGKGVQPPKDWDIVYRTVRMVEPLVDLWPFLTFDTRARVESLAHLPDWLRQQLVELDNAGDWSSALTILHRLHRQLFSEVQVIPLWEVSNFFVIRKNVVRPQLHSLRAAPMHVYQGIERWIVRP